MGKKTEKRGSNRVVSPKTGTLAVNLLSMAFWRELAGHVIPDEKDEYKIGEVALTLQQSCQAITSEHEFIDKICGKNADSKISFAIGVTIDRRTTPSEVAVKLGYSEKHSINLKAQVPDPNQDELPLQSSEKKSEEGESDLEPEAEAK